MTLDLAHLPLSVREQAFRSNEDRSRQVRTASWVGYARATRALERLEELIEHPGCARMPCLLIYGDSGMGKTMIVEKFERAHPPRHDRQSGVEHRPVLVIQMPPGPDERRFYARVLTALAAPYSVYWRLHAMERGAISALQLVQVKLLIVDEVHHLLAGSAREQRLALNLIKSIANELRIPIVAVGTADARHAIDSDAQMHRRFDVFALPRWSETEELREFVCAFGKVYPLRRRSELGERSLIHRLLEASEGITGPITRLLSLAAVEAIRSGSEQIDEATITRVASRLRQDAA